MLFLKSKDKNAILDFEGVSNFIQEDTVIGEIIRSFRRVIDRTFTGLIETGDLIFLFSEGDASVNFLRNQQRYDALRARIHYYRDEPDVWMLESMDGSQGSEYKFYVPERIMRMWQEYSFDKQIAINLKEQFFSRIFIFTSQEGRRGLPFIVVNIDQRWLDNIRQQ